MLKKTLAIRERLAEALAEAGIRLEEEGGQGVAAGEAAPGPPKRAAEPAGGGRLSLQARGVAEEERGGEGEFIVLEEEEQAPAPPPAPAPPAPAARPPAAPATPTAAPHPAPAAGRIAVDPFSLLEDPQLTEQERRAIAQALWRKLGPSPAFLRYLDYLTPEQVAEVLRSVASNPQTEVERVLAEALLKYLGGHGGLR